MKRIISVTATVVLVLGLLAGPALAKPGNNGNNGNNGGNSLRAQSTPAEVTVSESGGWYVIDHGLGASADATVWNEPVKYASNNQQATGSEEFDQLYLYAPSHESGHKGQVTVYYDLDGTWQHITAQFNGKGELVHVNGARL